MKMIRYSAVVLFSCVCLLNSLKSQVVITQPGNCADNGYVDFFRCMIQCYEEQYGITGLIEEDYCNNGVQVIIEGSGGVSYTVQDVKEAIQCVTEKCQSAVPVSICGDDSSPIITNLPDDVQDSIIQNLNSGKYEEAESDLQSESRKRRSHHHVSRKNNHHHRRMHRRNHLLKKLADSYGIKGEQLDELLAKLRKASGSEQGSELTDTSTTQSGQTDTSNTPSGQTDTSSSQSGQTDTSSTQSGQTDISTTQSGQTVTSGAQSEDELLTKLVEASEKLRQRTDASGIEITQVEELLAKLVEASGAQTYQDNAAASDLLSRLLGTSGLQIGQLNELLKTLEDVSGKKTSQLNDVSGILSALDDSGEDTVESGEYSDEPGEYSDESGGVGISSGSQAESFAFASGPQSKSIASASGTQSKSIASASGPQSEAFASASGPVAKGLAPAGVDYPDDCEEPDAAESDDSKSSTNNAAISDSSNTPVSYATSDSTVSVVTQPSFSTDTTSSTTTSGTSGSALSASATDSTGTSTGGISTGSLSTGPTPDGILDDCYEYEEHGPDFVAVPKLIEGNINNFQSASAVAVASSGSNSAKSSFGGLDYTTDDYNYDYDNDTYNYYNNDTTYYYDNGTYYNDDDIDYYYDNNTSYDNPNGGSVNAFAGFQGVNLNSGSKQYQGINEGSDSTTIQINQNPIIQSLETNGQNTGGLFSEERLNTGLLPNTFVQNINQNPTSLNNGVGVSQNTGPLLNAPIERQLQNQNQDQLQGIFAQLQGINQRLPIQQNQDNINNGGATATSGQTPGQSGNSNQGVYSNPMLQQYQNNQYSSGVSTNQQYLSQSSNTPLQPNTYPSNGAAVGTIYIAGSGSSGQMQPITANTPVQNQAFFGSNIRNGPFNIPQNNGFAQQTNSAGSNAFVVSSSATAGADSRGGNSGISQVFAGNNPVPSQAGIFGPSLNSPQTNGGGINSASNLGSATAGAFVGSPGQNQGRSGNVPFFSQFFKGNGPVLNNPQYNGNAAQTNGGGFVQITRGAGASNFAPGVSNYPAYQGFNSETGISINSPSFSGNNPTNQGAVPSSGNSAYAASFANTGSSANAGSSGYGGVVSSANVQSYAM